MRWSVRRRYIYRTARYNVEPSFVEAAGLPVHPRFLDLDISIPRMKSALHPAVHSPNKKMIRRRPFHTPIFIFSVAFIKRVFNKAMTIKAQCLLLYVRFWREEYE